MKNSILLLPLSILSICLCSCSQKSDYERFKEEFLERYGVGGVRANYIPRNGYYSIYTSIVEDQNYFSEASFEGHLAFTRGIAPSYPNSSEFRYVRKDYEAGERSKETRVLFDGKKLSITQTNITYGDSISSSSSLSGRYDVTSCGLTIPLANGDFNLLLFWPYDQRLADGESKNLSFDGLASYWDVGVVGNTLMVESGDILENVLIQGTSIYEFDSDYQLAKTESYLYFEQTDHADSLTQKEYPACRYQFYSKLEYVDSIEDIVPLDFAQEADIEVKDGYADDLFNMYLYKQSLEDTQL
ncbi:MAG: hypothetical protein Q4F15_03565 [Bacillota bacterium]|nr:hypothetical protein [Bacillota bacterium]